MTEHVHPLSGHRTQHRGRGLELAPRGMGGAQTTDPETTDQRWAAHLEQPPAEQLLDQTCAPEHVLVEAGVDHAGVRGIGSDGAALGGQQAL